MKNIIVPLNAFSKHDVFEKGQQFFVPMIAEAGAYGVEIRRELFLEDEVVSLSEIGREAEKYQLFTVYSAPIEVWGKDGELNKLDLQQVFDEAEQLGAKWVKTSLGRFDTEHSSLDELKQFLNDLELREKGMLLLIENDQTFYGGDCKRLSAFFESVDATSIPVKMTFDLGNWMYTGEDAMQAMGQLFQHVIYLHLKHVERTEGKLITLPLPRDEHALWRRAVSFFSPSLVKAIEFPVEPVEKLKDYIEMVQDGVRK